MGIHLFDMKSPKFLNNSYIVNKEKYFHEDQYCGSDANHILAVSSDICIHDISENRLEKRIWSRYMKEGLVEYVYSESFLEEITSSMIESY